MVEVPEMNLNVERATNKQQLKEPAVKGGQSISREETLWVLQAIIDCKELLSKYQKEAVLAVTSEPLKMWILVSKWL